MSDYQLRKDVDNLKTFLNRVREVLNEKYDIADIDELLAMFYDSSEVDLIKAQLLSDLNALNDCLVSFNEVLIQFDVDNTNLSTDLTKLSNNLQGLIRSVNGLDSDLSNLVSDLNTLSDYLTAFEGSLSDFEDELTDNGVDISSINSDLIKLFHSIGTVKNDISTVQTDIGDTSAITGTVVSNITTAQGQITTVQGDISDVQEEMYKGDGTGTVSNPASGTVMRNIKTAQNDIKTCTQSIDNFMGIRDNGYKVIYIFYDDFEEFYDEMHEIGYEIKWSDTDYGYDYTNNVVYTIVTGHPTNPEVLGYWDLSQNNNPSSISTSIGLCYILNHTSIKSNEVYDVIYEAKTNLYYIKENGLWKQAESVGDVLSYLSMIQKVKGYMLDKTYPVGAVYISVNNTNPSILFGGTWEQLEGRFLLGAGDLKDSNDNIIASYTNGDTDGEVNHTLSVNEMPSHNHRVSSGWQSASGIDRLQFAQLSGGYNNNGTGDVQFIESTGGGQAHNNMPPYIAVYMWKRTA